MINTKYLLYISTCLLVSGNVQASNFKLTYDSSDIFSHGSALHTPNELKPISLFNPDNAVKLAAVCAVGGGGCAGLTFGSSGNSMNLDGASQCDDEGYVNSCPEGQVKDESNLCPYNASYFKCRNAENKCKSGYVLDNLQCPPGQIQDVTDTYINEAGNTCILCRVQTCEDGGYSDSITSCQKGTPVSFAFQTCYQDVTDKTCEDMGYLSSEPENNICVPVTECGKSCQKGCYQPTCEDGGYKSGIPDNNICTQIDYYGNKCFDNCYQPTCDNGGYLDAQPAGQTCTPITYYGRNCFQNDCKVNEVEIACEIGSVLYENKKCYSSTTKTPIAVVFDPDKQLAVAIDQSSGIWTMDGFGIDITSLGNSTSAPLFNGLSGKVNTAAIIAFGKSNSISYPAAEYCYNYTTIGTKAGDWYLPSLTELNSIARAKSMINATLNLLGKSSLSQSWYWSSSENNSTNSWQLYLDNGHYDKTYKSTSADVRPVINYGTTKETEITCTVGSVLYEDKKCYSSTAKTPIAIIFDDKAKLAMALESASNITWGGSGTKITSLENCSSTGNCGADGKTNTMAIITFGKANNISYPAAEYCDQYTTTGTSAGEWFLPSLMELASIHSVRDIINNTLTQLGKSTFSGGWHWSSTEGNSTQTWKKEMNSMGQNLLTPKTTIGIARPVIQYEGSGEVEITCTIGSVLYEDKKCYSSTSKTPIGIVFDDTNGIAIALENAPNTLEWGGYGTNIPSMEDCTRGEPLSCGTDGKVNTAAIITFGKSNSISYPAAEYCNKYTTSGTKAGDWHLPSYTELKSIYNAKRMINIILNQLDKSLLTENYYWSSTEVGDYGSWLLNMSSSGNLNSKNTNAYVRPAIAYDK